MLKRRIIPCLDIRNGRTVKGINFKGLRDAGDPVELARRYSEEGADELVFLDISATLEARKTLTDLVERVARAINIPFTVGGGIGEPVQVRELLDAGADKVSINSAAVKNPGLISTLSQAFGSQCVVVAIDARKEEDEWMVCTHGGQRPTLLTAPEWSAQAEQLGAGEILLTSMDRDGTRAGFDLELLQAVEASCNLPIIASGGAGNSENFIEVFRETSATGALAASIFHFGEVPIPKLKQTLQNAQIPVR